MGWLERGGGAAKNNNDKKKRKKKRKKKTATMKERTREMKIKSQKEKPRKEMKAGTPSTATVERLTKGHRKARLKAVVTEG